MIIPVAALTADRLRLRGIGLLGLIGYIAYDGLLAEHTDRLVDVYIEQQLTDSQGAFIRLAMNAVPAMLFMVLGKRFLMAPSEYRLWRAISLISIAMFVALLMTGFTTALDRMALYFIPLQLVVFAHLPDALGRKKWEKTPPSCRVLLGIMRLYFLYGSTSQHILNTGCHTNSASLSRLSESFERLCVLSIDAVFEWCRV